MSSPIDSFACGNLDHLRVRFLLRYHFDDRREWTRGSQIYRVALAYAFINRGRTRSLPMGV